jgi:hypothetical protein
MATELPPAVARFTADVSQYTEPLQKAIAATQQFGDRTDTAALKARQMGLETMEAADKAAAAMDAAKDAAERYARGEIDLATAQRAATAAAKQQAQADLELAALQESVAKANDNVAKSNQNVSKSADDASKSSFGEASMFSKIWTIASFATSSLEPLAAGLIAVTGGLVSGVAAAGIGLGAFALVAKSSFTTASTAATAAQAANTAYASSVKSTQSQYAKIADMATTSFQRQLVVEDEAGALAQDQATKVAALKAAYAGLNSGQISLAKSINVAKSSLTSFEKANSSGVSQVMSEGIGLLPRALQLLQPFLAPTEKALTGIVNELKMAMSPAQTFSTSLQKISERAGVKLSSQPGGLTTFMQTMSQNAGPAIQKILQSVMNLAGGIGHLLEAFAPFAQVVLSGLQQMTSGFDKWAGSLSKTKGFSEFMTMVKTQGPTVVNELKNLVGIAAKFIGDMAGSDSNMTWMKYVPGLLQFANAFMKTHTALVENIMNLMMYKSIAGQAFGAISKGFNTLKTGYTAITTTTKNLKNLKSGFDDAKKAASEATGPWGTAGGAIKKALSYPSASLSNLKKGMQDADSAASESTGMWGTLGGNITKAITAVKGWTIWSKISAAATKVWTGIQMAFNAVMDMNPIILITIAIIALVAIVVLCYIHFKTFRDVVNDVGRALRTGFLDALHAVETAAKATIQWLKSNWMLIAGILLGPIALAAALIFKYWKQIKGFFSAAINDVLNFLKSHWELIISIIGGPMVAAVVFIVTHWKQITQAFSDGYNDVIKWVKKIGTDILGYFKDAGAWLLNAGKHLIEGFVSGIEEIATDPLKAVQNIAHNVVGAVKSVLGIFSPSTVFAEIGTQIVAGLALGMNTSKASAEATAGQIGNTIAIAAMTGAISSTQESALKSQLSNALSSAINGGMEKELATGTAAEVNKVVTSLKNTLSSATAGGDISSTKESSLSKWLTNDNATLSKLATQRTNIATQIADAGQFAQSTAAAAVSNYTLSSATTNSSGGTASVNQIISTLSGDVGQIQSFKVNLQKLAKMGLNKDYLNQIISMGPVQGGQLAAELAAANLTQIAQINTAQTQIGAATNSLGQSAANVMYESGTQAGAGFLSGLKAQQSAINSEMQTIAKNMVTTLKKELGISSPSKVMMQHGLMVAEGLAQGMESGATRVAQAAGKLSSAAVAGTASLSSGSRTVAGAAQPITINLRNEVAGKVNEKELWSAVQQQTFRYNIRNAGTVTGTMRPG